MSHTRISVVIPSYNVAGFIGHAIQSALDQTMRPADIVVVDGESSDGTLDVVRRFGTAVTLLVYPKSGTSKARNEGIRAATGEWIAFLDADDTWLPDKLERQMAVLRPTDTFVHCGRINEGDLDGLPVIHSELQPLCEGDVFVDLMARGNTITTSTVVVKRETLLSVGGFDEGLPHAEDWDLWIRMSATHEVRACWDALVRYRLHDASSSRTSSVIAQNRTRLAVVARALGSERGSQLGRLVRHRIYSTTLATNAWDASRSGRRLDAARHYVEAALWWPFDIGIYRGMARLALGR